MGSWPGDAAFVDLLVNRAQSYIYTTAPTPTDSAAALAALRLLSTPEGERLRPGWPRHIERVAPGHPSPIIPIVLGNDDRAVAASAALREHGVWVPAVSSVASGTARLRVTLSAAHSSDHIDLLLDALAAVPTSPGPETLNAGRLHALSAPARQPTVALPFRGGPVRPLPRRRGGTRTILPSLPPWAKRS